MADILQAEWVKARTVRLTWMLLAGAVVATAGLSVLVAASTSCSSQACGQDPAKVSLTGVLVGQAVVAVLAVLAIGDEYGTGMIRVTFAAMPGRLRVLAAKAAVLGGLVLAVSAVAVVASAAVGAGLLPGHGFDAGHGYPGVSLTSGPWLRAVAGTVLYLALIALLSLGVAAAVRDSAVATGIVLALLFVFPIITHFVSNTVVQRHLEQISPMTAGLYIQATVGVRGLPLSPWQGLGVLALWAAGALLLGGLVLRVRDALPSPVTLGRGCRSPLTSRVAICGSR
jgi:ABC-2 type transport system permease protein